MYLVASEVRVVQQQIKNTSGPAPISQIDSDLRNAGVRLIDTSVAEPDALQGAVYYASLTQALVRTLNRPTEVRLEESDALYAWIKMPENDTLWLRVPLAEMDTVYPPPQYVFILAITILSLLGGWWVARSISRPLKRLEFAAREVGRGDRPGDLKVVGTTELRAVTTAFNQMARDVEQLEEDRTLLLAGISHDLRTPITRVRLACEFLPDSEEEVRDGIIRDTEDMDEIIDQFIGFVRDGRDEPFKREDLNEMIKLVARPHDNSEIEIKLDLSPLPNYHFKPLAMKRLVMNLLENAIRYGKPPITINTSSDKHNIYLNVQDRGEGIDEDKLDELFQPFKRGDSARQGKGTGLGLAIVKRIASLHEGEVTLANMPQGGVEARLVLPRERRRRTQN
jgi:two-component system osmolarity sensor histidine kinase EnvZ